MSALLGGVPWDGLKQGCWEYQAENRFMLSILHPPIMSHSPFWLSSNSLLQIFRSFECFDPWMIMYPTHSQNSQAASFVALLLTVEARRSQDRTNGMRSWSTATIWMWGFRLGWYIMIHLETDQIPKPFVQKHRVSEFLASFNGLRFCWSGSPAKDGDKKGAS